jgi:ribonuclease R
MKFSVATLLASFTDDKLVAPKALEKKLGCDATEDQAELDIALEALEKVGILAKERGKYRRSESEWVEGRLRCSSKGFCFAIQDAEDAEDIYIRESHLNHAWNGDRVLVHVTKDGSRRRSPEGEVRLIVERANTSVLARVKQTEEQTFRAVPLDDRLLFEVDLRDSQALDQAIDHLVNVEVIRYPLGKHAPIGRVTQVLGSDAETASDLEIICCKHSLPRTFSEASLALANSYSAKVKKAEHKGRLDLRDRPTLALYSGAEGLSPIVDNAITIEKNEAEEGWTVIVHTVDVAYYVPMGSPIDQDAQRRGTTVYLGDTILPLIPETLTQGLCSLEAGQERLTLSLLLTLDGTGQVTDFEIQPAVIKVNQSLSYDQAQAMIDGQGRTKDNLGQAPLLAEVAALLRQQRRSRGGLDFNLPEYDRASNSLLGNALYSKFAYGDEGSIGAMVNGLPVRGFLAEVLILANQTIASHLKALAIPGLYRIHRAPDPMQAQDMVRLLANMDLDLTLSEEGAQPQDYQRFLDVFAQSPTERVLTYLLQETLKPAGYSAQPGRHFGLAIEDGYCHMTSPSRRYADLFVQQLLRLVISEGRDRKTARSKDIVNLRNSASHGQINWPVLPDHQADLEAQVQLLAVQLSEREKRALESEDDLIGLKKAEFMKAHTGELFQGLITGVQSYGFFVEIETLLVEGLVHVSSLKDDWYEFRSRQQRLVGRKSRRQYRLGDRVEVQVKSVDYYRQQIDLGVVGGGSEGSEEDDNDDRDDIRPIGHDPEIGQEAEPETNGYSEDD